jgi:transcriptional regulator GlxA family with amidase domain
MAACCRAATCRRCRPTWRCAIRYLRANLDKPVTMHALAAHCGVCERTLQLGFRKSKNITPMEYLRLLRLQGAREALQHATPGPGWCRRLPRGMALRI